MKRAILASFFAILILGACDRIASDESAANGNLRAITGAEVAYYAANNAYADLSALLQAEVPYLAGDWTGPKSGYLFTLDCPGFGPGVPVPRLAGEAQHDRQPELLRGSVRRDSLQYRGACD